MMPFLPDNALPADCYLVTWLASEPPFLIPIVPAAFDPHLVMGQRAAFRVPSHRRVFISAKVVSFGENKHGERGYVALTEQGITVRGWMGVYPRSGGGTETFWDVCIFGLEARLVRSVAAHRQKYPREVPLGHPPAQDLRHCPLIVVRLERRVCARIGTSAKRRLGADDTTSQPSLGSRSVSER